MDHYRSLLQETAASNQDTAPFFGFIGAAAALVFSCEYGGGRREEETPHSRVRVGGRQIRAFWPPVTLQLHQHASSTINPAACLSRGG